MLSPEEQLELVALSNDDFSEGLARLVKLFTDGKLSKPDVSTFAAQVGEGSGNYILLENNTPISGE